MGYHWDMKPSLTKILATIGPSSQDPATLRQLFESGVNACRLNFSHGTHEEHAQRIALIRKIAKEIGRPISIVMDLCGPKVRTDTQTYQVQKGELWTLVPGTGDASLKRIGISHPSLHTLVPVHARILFDDGKFAVQVKQVLPDGLLCEFFDSGTLKPRKAVNTPGIDNELSVLSEKDVADLSFGISQKVDWVAVSFVRSAWDMQQVRNYLNHHDWYAGLIAKIETPLAIGNLEEIIRESDGVMVARGDLGIECPMEEIPVHQRHILELAHQYGRLSIVATQMLESMIENPRPTRAEITDIAHAVSEGTHVVMLSGETASGKYPVEAVQVMKRTLERAEADRKSVIPERPKGIDPSDEILWAAVKIQARTNAAAIVVLCNKPQEVSVVASLESRAPIIAVCASEEMARRSNLYYGVSPILVESQSRISETIQSTLTEIELSGLMLPHQQYVFVYDDHCALKLVQS